MKRIFNLLTKCEESSTNIYIYINSSNDAVKSIQNLSSAEAMSLQTLQQYTYIHQQFYKFDENSSKSMQLPRRTHRGIRHFIFMENLRVVERRRGGSWLVWLFVHKLLRPTTIQRQNNECRCSLCCCEEIFQGMLRNTKQLLVYFISIYLGSSMSNRSQKNR